MNSKCVSFSMSLVAVLLAGTTQAVAGTACIKENGMDMIALSNRFGTATVSLRGAQVRSYKPAGMAEDVLFAPKTTTLEGTKDDRGGIPVCWPWFGRNGEPGTESHGFARYSRFEVRGQKESDDGTTLTLGLKPTSETRKVWPYDFDLEYTIRLGATLDLSLRTRNTDARPVKITEGLHPYWRVSDRRKVRVDGLDSCPYCFADVSQVADQTWKGTFVPDRHLGPDDRLARQRLLEDRDLDARRGVREPVGGRCPPFRLRGACHAVPSGRLHTCPRRGTRSIGLHFCRQINPRFRVFRGMGFRIDRRGKKG